MSDDRETVCSRVVLIDSEFDAKKGRGERPGPPICICAIEIDQDCQKIEHRLAAPYPAQPPWDRGDPFLTIGFALSAEAGSFLHVNWPFPLPAIDLYAEYMTIHNTEMSRGGDGKQPINLVQACQRYRVAAMDKTFKADMRSLAYTKTNHTAEEIALLQDYCIEDVRMTMRLLSGDATARRSIARTGSRRVHDGNRAHTLARHSDRYGCLSSRATTRARSRIKNAHRTQPHTWRRGLFSRRVQAENHVSRHATERDPHSDRSENGKFQLRYKIDQEHDLDLSAVETLLRI